MTDHTCEDALAALAACDDREVQQVLGWLCSASPDAVLQAIAGVRRHHQVVAQLRASAPRAER